MAQKPTLSKLELLAAPTSLTAKKLLAYRSGHCGSMSAEVMRAQLMQSFPEDYRDARLLAAYGASEEWPPQQQWEVAGVLMKLQKMKRKDSPVEEIASLRERLQSLIQKPCL
jgi:hypothetical protein